MVHIHCTYLPTTFDDSFTAFTGTSFVWDTFLTVFASGGADNTELHFLREDIKN